MSSEDPQKPQRVYDLIRRSEAFVKRLKQLLDIPEVEDVLAERGETFEHETMEWYDDIDNYDKMKEAVKIKFCNPECSLKFRSVTKRRTAVRLYARVECRRRRCFQGILKVQEIHGRNVLLVEELSKSRVHEALEDQLRGKERARVKQMLQKESVPNVEVALALEGKPPPSKPVLRTAKRETREQECSLTNYLANNPDHLSCVRAFNPAWPLYILLSSSEPLQVLDAAQSKSLYLDATGGLFSTPIERRRLLKNCPETTSHRNLMYSGVVKHKNEDESGIGVINMLSSQHTTAEVSYFLQVFRGQLMQTGRSKPGIMHCESDFSWPLIFSILRVFGEYNLSGYLEKCFNVFNGEDEDDDIFVHHLCSSHMMHTFMRHPSLKKMKK